MDTFKKPSDQIAAMMQHWFLHYHGKDKALFSGSEDFTLFDLVPESLKNGILQRITLHEDEIAIFLLTCEKSVFILNTTHRFIRVSKTAIESIFYKDFLAHKGYKSLMVDTTQSIKTDGYFAEFGLKTRSGEVFFWSIPSGKPGFAFWNITKKCELIGRKYL